MPSMWMVREKMKLFISVFALIAFLVSSAAMASQETLTPVEYRLGNHNVSFAISNVDEYVKYVEPPIYDSDAKYWTYTLNMSHSIGNNIFINLYEYASSQSTDFMQEEKKILASGFDLVSIGGYNFTDITIDGHLGYMLYIPNQRLLAHTKYEQVMPEQYTARYLQDDKTSLSFGVNGLGEDVFKQLVSSVHVKNI
jgi:hypothetical protein